MASGRHDSDHLERRITAALPITLHFDQRCAQSIQLKRLPHFNTPRSFQALALGIASNFSVSKRYRYRFTIDSCYPE